MIETRKLYLAKWGWIIRAGFVTAQRESGEVVIQGAPILHKHFPGVTLKEVMVERLEKKGYEVELIETWVEGRE